MLAKLANELDGTSDYLMDGSMDDRALESISDKELLSQFQRAFKITTAWENYIILVISLFSNLRFDTGQIAFYHYIWKSLYKLYHKKKLPFIVATHNKAVFQMKTSELI